MSIVFKPKFPNRFIPPVSAIPKLNKEPKTNGKPFGPVEINDLVFLRAINMSYNDIAKRLHRSPATLAWVVCDRGLSSQIEGSREHLIEYNVSGESYEQNKEEAKDGR
jgi:hypothetical protein